MSVVRAPLLREAVADALAEMITRGELLPGQRLQEAALCTRLGVSRSPLRDAFRTLEAQGLVRIEPRRGAFVATMDSAEIESLFDCRILIQPELVRLSVAALEPEGIDSLGRVLERMETATAERKVFDFLDEVEAFLEVLEAACPNVLLAELVQSLWRRGMRFRVIGQRQPHQMERSLDDHRTLLANIRDGDAAEASAVMLRMIKASRAAVLEALKVNPQAAKEERPSSATPPSAPAGSASPPEGP